MINVAVVGVGRWGVHLLRNFLALPDVNVMAVVDPHADRLATVKQQFHLDESFVLTTNWQDLAQLSGLTAVAIATPATTHYALVKDALNWGYHVLAEKPLTLDPAECQELCELAEQQQLILMVDHTYLFHPAVEKGQAVVRSGKLGDLRYGYAARTHLGPVRQDVDALWDLAIHDIAIFNHWLGQVPTSVQATGKVWLQNAASREISHFPSGLADLVWVTLTYPNGFQAYIHLCWLNPDKQRRLAVVGNLGTLVFDEMSPSSPLTLLHGEFERQGNLFLPANQSQEVLELETAEPLKTVCSTFVSSILQKTPVKISSGRVGTELVKVLCGLTTSLNQGGQLVTL